MAVAGELFLFASGATRLAAFMSGVSLSNKTCLVVVGGMTDGLLFAGAQPPHHSPH